MKHLKENGHHKFFPELRVLRGSTIVQCIYKYLIMCPRNEYNIMKIINVCNK